MQNSWLAAGQARAFPSARLAILGRPIERNATIGQLIKLMIIELFKHNAMIGQIIK